MKQWWYLLLGILIAGLAGCGADGEIGYSPPLIPIRVSVDSQGYIKASFDKQIRTPLGTLDIGAETTLGDLNSQSTQRMLIVRLDQKAVVYPLEIGKNFHVEFAGEGQLYRKVRLEQHANGNIVLELESVHPTADIPDVVKTDIPDVAEAYPFSGRWRGQLFQRGGPTRDAFDFELLITQNGDQLTGTSRITVPNHPTYYGQMQFTGSVTGRGMQFEETGMIEDYPEPATFWCMKSGYLELTSDGTTLNGSWQAATCAPGTVVLVKQPE